MVGDEGGVTNGGRERCAKKKTVKNIVHEVEFLS